MAGNNWMSTVLSRDMPNHTRLIIAGNAGLKTRHRQNILAGKIVMCNASEYASTVQPSDWLACIQHDTKMHCRPRVFIFCLSLFV